MQTILGANGQIAEELAIELYKNYTKRIRLVSRNPKKVNETDSLFPANLMDYEATSQAVEGSQIVYLTVGLPMHSEMWENQFPIIMYNVIEACKKHACKLVFFDNTYMYAKDSKPQTEDSHFEPTGRKSKVRATIANMLLKEIQEKKIEAVICRAPEFYGPSKTQSITNTMIFNAIKEDKKLKIPLKSDTIRTLIWTPDASRAMALIGNTHEAYQQTWHLPCPDGGITYKEMIDFCSKKVGKTFKYKIINSFVFKIGSWFNPQIKELQELLPRYSSDNLFLSVKFKKKFPSFKITSYEEGISMLLNEVKP